VNPETEKPWLEESLPEISNPEAKVCLQSVFLDRGQGIVFKNLSTTFYSGRAYLIQGSNGAGKTSLLELIAGTLRPNSGEVLREAPTGMELSISYAAVESFLYEDLTVRENLEFFAKLSLMSSAAVDESLVEWGMERYADEPITSLSSGMAKRVSLARAFLGASKFLLVDEPLSFLDQDGIGVLRIKLEDYVSLERLTISPLEGNAGADEMGPKH